MKNRKMVRTDKSTLTPQVKGGGGVHIVIYIYIYIYTPYYSQIKDGFNFHVP